MHVMSTVFSFLDRDNTASTGRVLYLFRHMFVVEVCMPDDWDDDPEWLDEE